MKKWILAASIFAMLAQSGGAVAARHDNKHAVDIHEDAGRPCMFFRLNGVTQADPAVSATEWFALPRDHLAYGELVAMLFTAKAARLPISVQTTGAVACGHMAVDFILLL